MHILFLTHYFPPEVNAPASRTYEHAKRWVRHEGVQVTVVTNHPNHPKGELYPGYVNQWLLNENKEGIRVKRVKTFLAPNSGVVMRTLNYLFFMLAAPFGARGVKNPDVVVATSPQFFCAVAGLVVSRLKGCPFVFELRDIWPDSIVTVGAMKKSWTISLLEKLEIFLYRKASMIVAVTDGFREHLIERGIPAEKIRVIKNGVDLDFFKPLPCPETLRKRVGGEGKFVASYIGTVGMAHAVDRIVEVAERLREEPDILFLILGEGARKKSIEQMVEEKGLTNIKVLPGVTKDEVRDYYALTDLNLVTLRDKPLFLTVIPSKIFEIMGMSRPILTSVDGESRKIVEEAGAGVFVQAENVEEMANSIRLLSKDRDNLHKMGESGRRYVEVKASRDVHAEHYLLLLSALTGNRLDEVKAEALSP